MYGHTCKYKAITPCAVLGKNARYTTSNYSNNQRSVSTMRVLKLNRSVVTLFSILPVQVELSLAPLWNRLGIAKLGHCMVVSI